MGTGDHAAVADHAQVGNAVVTVAFLGSAVTLDIFDDGVGGAAAVMVAYAERMSRQR